MSLRVFQKGEVIFREGDGAESMFDIYWGRVGIYSSYGAENEHLLTELRDGQFFGEMGMIDHSPRSATAVALEDDTQAEEISEEQFTAYFQNQPMRVLMIMRNMGNRIREQGEELERYRAALDAQVP